MACSPVQQTLVFQQALPNYHIYTRLVLKTSSITTAANVKLKYEIELVSSLIFCAYLMRPISSKLCALSYVLIFDLQLSMFTFLWLQI